MCQAKEHFIFCSCVDKKKDISKGTRNHYYSWRLMKYIGSKKTRIMGKIKIPHKALGNGVSIDAICQQLNSNFQSFDFEYTPSERDSLHIKVSHPFEDFKYFTLIFKDNVWQSGSNPVFTSITEKIASGRFKKQTIEKQYISKQNDYLKAEADDLETIFSQIITNKSTYQSWKRLQRKIQQEPHFFLPKVAKLYQSKIQEKRLTASFILILLYYYNFKAQQVKKMLYDLLQTEHVEEIISLVIRAFSIRKEGLSEEYINLIYNFKFCENDVKHSIMFAFAGLKHEKVVDVFIEFSNDSNSEIRKTALFNLRQINKLTNTNKIKNVFQKRVGDTYQPARLEAILGLAELKDENSANYILKELETLNTQSALLLDAIAILGDTDFIPHLESQIEKHKNSDTRLSKLIQQTIEYLKK